MKIDDAVLPQGSSRAKEVLEFLLSEKLIALLKDKEVVERELERHEGQREYIVFTGIDKPKTEIIVRPIDPLEYRGKNKMFDQDLQQKVQGYINCFRNEIGQYLAKNIGQKFNVVSFSSGVIIEVEQGIEFSNSDSFKGEVSSIKEAFDRLGRTPEQYLVNEDTIAKYRKALDENKIDTEGGKILVGNSIPSILIIANDSDNLWNPEDAKEHVETIVDFMEKMNSPKPNK